MEASSDISPGDTFGVLEGVSVLGQGQSLHQEQSGGEPEAGVAQLL